MKSIYSVVINHPASPIEVDVDGYHYVDGYGLHILRDADPSEDKEEAEVAYFAKDSLIGFTCVVHE